MASVLLRAELRAQGQKMAQLNPQPHLITEGHCARLCVHGTHDFMLLGVLQHDVGTRKRLLSQRQNKIAQGTKESKTTTHSSLGITGHAWNPSTLGSWGRRIESSRQERETRRLSETSSQNKMKNLNRARMLLSAKILSSIAMTAK